MSDSMTWRKVRDQALNDTRHSFKGKRPEKEEFLETFKTFYDELMAENKVTIWPVDPAASHRMAKQRAATVWADDFSD